MSWTATSYRRYPSGQSLSKPVGQQPHFPLMFILWWKTRAAALHLTSMRAPIGFQSRLKHVFTSTGVLRAIRERGAHPGIVLNPGTPASSLKEILHLVDLVLVMTVNPGYSGQSFLPHVAHKVAEIRSMLDETGSSTRLEVDGGIAPATVPVMIEAGADTFVAASAIFKHPQGAAAGTMELIEAIRGLEG